MTSLITNGPMEGEKGFEGNPEWPTWERFIMNVGVRQERMSALEIMERLKGWQVSLETEILLEGQPGTVRQLQELLKSGAEWGAVCESFGIVLPEERHDGDEPALMKHVAGLTAWAAAAVVIWLVPEPSWWWLGSALLVYAGCQILASHLAGEIDRGKLWTTFFLCLTTVTILGYQWIDDPLYFAVSMAGACIPFIAYLIAAEARPGNALDEADGAILYSILFGISAVVGGLLGGWHTALMAVGFPLFFVASVVMKSILTAVLTRRGLQWPHWKDYV